MTEFHLHEKNPPHRLFAYVHSLPNHQVMGVTVDSITGRMIEHCILPTKQRVMLGLGIGDENAHAHNTYRQKYGKYELLWIEDPDTDPRTQRLKETLNSERQVRNGIHRALAEPDSIQHTEKAQSTDADLTSSGELTAQLVRAGAEQAAEKQPERSPEVEAINDEKPDRDPSVGGFF